MSSRRLREWPRLVAAVVVLAAVLIMIGVVVASASSGSGGSSDTNKPNDGTDHSAALAALRHETAVQDAQLRDSALALKKERAAATHDAAALAAARRALRVSRRATQCWKARALQPRRSHADLCAPPR
jgi:hypothetical protein